jgi:adenine-specific DNA methylase
MKYRSYILDDFPIVEVSESSQREKSIRQGHISTLQMWWARRPLAVSRAAIFAALCPSIEEFERNPNLKMLLDDLVPGDQSIKQKLYYLTAELSKWESTSNYELLKNASKLLQYDRDTSPLVADTFAGGGSLPIEALRLGLDAYAGELNPVAATALSVAIELLPQVDEHWITEFESIVKEIENMISTHISHLYGTPGEGIPLAFHWCRTYICPICGITVPLLQNKWLAKGKNPVAIKVNVNQSNKNIQFQIVVPKTQEEKKDADLGTASNSGATCLACGNKVLTSWLREAGSKGLLGEQLFAIHILKGGSRSYILPTENDLLLTKNCTLSNLPSKELKNVPSLEFDLNGIRHTWAYQYGVKKTSDLYNSRQSVALLELYHILVSKKREILSSSLPELKKKLFILLLSLIFNRIVLYCNKHTWWQSNGEFPANMFGHQAIAMVWDYVEIPINNPKAAGWKSAADWILKVVKNLLSLPKKGIVRVGDAKKTNLNDHSVDLVAIDPPYYDSIAYSYLSDVFYVWMREFLNEYPELGFNNPLSPKEDEAIVDRPHTLAPNPKGDTHFRNKMKQAFLEAKRILKPNGAMLLMYGHKKTEAWSALIEPVLAAGFDLVASWPVHMERKTKFQHGKVASLSSSCILVCVPSKGNNKKKIDFNTFVSILKEFLKKHIIKYSSANIFGNNLAMSLLFPSCSLLGKYMVVTENGEEYTISNLLETLPDIIAQVEIQTIMENLAKHDLDDFEMQPFKQLLSSFPTGIKTISGKSWWTLDFNSKLTTLARELVESLNLGLTSRVDDLINKLKQSEKQLLLLFVRLASLCSLDDPDGRSKAEAILGRISLVNRKISK